MRVSPLVIAGTLAVLAALWLVDLCVLHTQVLTSFQRHAALTPLYAFAMPVVRVQALVYMMAAASLVLGAPRACDTSRTSRAAFALAIFGASCALPLALFLVRQDPRELGSQFDIYRNEEFYHDAQRIKDLGYFLQHYVELMPQLSLHGRHFPPGHALLLYCVRVVFGTGTLATGIAVLFAFGIAVVIAWRALAQITDEVAARQGAVLLLASPSLIDFACTSMDAVFLMFAAIAWWRALRAFQPQARWIDAALAGVALFVATIFSFSALPLGLAVFLYALLRARKAPRLAFRQLAWTGFAYAAAALALYASTGFAIWSCLAQARASGVKFMAQLLGGDPKSQYAHLSYGNAAAFMIGSGVALVAAACVRLRARRFELFSWSTAALLTLAIMAFGGIYYMETERIWMFAMPWLAAIAVSSGGFAPSSLRALLVAGVGQALAMEIALFTLW